ncbi:transglutaminase-like domain-containing protein [Paenibacillus daejeonensis]|uniref:transglutaminase-like domain-containing protein n=1 Tax=Paenibacillus daejeonensis TaxID=135193 RepID=UPI000369BE10|nr:transglutaminase domain-containing protein [Paenibacillus daejeonensis]
MLAFLKGRRVTAGTQTGGASLSGKTIPSVSDEAPPPAWLVRAITSLLLFVLLREWLLPLSYISAWTDLTRVDVIIYSVAFALVCGTLVLSWKRLPLLLGAGLALAVPWLYYGGSGLGSWLPRLTTVFLEDARMLMAGKPILSPELRTVLLLSGCMALSCAIQSLMWLRGWGAGIALATGLFVLNLEWWFGIDALMPLLRILIAGGILAVLLTYNRAFHAVAAAVQTKEAPRQNGWPLRWLGAALLAVTMLLGAGWWAASERPTADEPAPWAAHWQEQGEAWLMRTMHREAGVRHASDRAGAQTTAGQQPVQLGYGDDDSRLGAPLASGESLLFTAYATAPVTYWRGEAKTFYDGSGWHTSSPERLASPLDLPYASERMIQALAGQPQNDESIYSAALGDSPDPAIRYRLEYPQPQAGLPLFSVGIDTRVLRVDAGSERMISYERDRRTDSLFPARKRVAVSRVELESRVSELSHERTVVGNSRGRDEMSPVQEIQIRDALQLPSSVSERTTALARTITEAAGSDAYARALAMERFLQENYRYTLQDTAVPGAGQDFVDHFLFDQQTGYCVHFASAMTVMLRTLDIPARWVKGFASPTTPLAQPLLEQGAGASAGDAELISYGYRADVDQRDAHAWVEAYIEGSGWVRFDPTPPAAVGTTVAVGATGSGVDADQGVGQDSGRFTGSDGDTLTRWTQGVQQAGEWTAQHVALGLQSGADYSLEMGQHMQSVVNEARELWSLRAATIWFIGFMMLAVAVLVLWERRNKVVLALALRSYQRACGAGRPTRHKLLAVIRQLWPLVARTYGGRRMHVSGREYVRSLTMSSSVAECLLTLVRWEEDARYGAGAWQHPDPGELRAVLTELQAGMTGRRSLRSILNLSTPSLPGRREAK